MADRAPASTADPMFLHAFTVSVAVLTVVWLPVRLRYGDGIAAAAGSGGRWAMVSAAVPVLIRQIVVWRRKLPVTPAHRRRAAVLAWAVGGPLFGALAVADVIAGRYVESWIYAFIVLLLYVTADDHRTADPPP